MPARRKHLELDLLFINTYNLDMRIEDLILIEALIDEPAKYAGIISRLAVHKNCNSTILNNLLNSYRAGLRFNGVFSHDWGLNRYKRGKSSSILKNLVSCIFGYNSVLIVDLHSSIDMIYSGRFRDKREYRKWAERIGMDRRVIEFVERVFGSLVR